MSWRWYLALSGQGPEGSARADRSEMLGPLVVRWQVLSRGGVPDERSEDKHACRPCMVKLHTPAEVPDKEVGRACRSQVEKREYHDHGNALDSPCRRPFDTSKCYRACSQSRMAHTRTANALFHPLLPRFHPVMPHGRHQEAAAAAAAAKMRRKGGKNSRSSSSSRRRRDAERTAASHNATAPSPTPATHAVGGTARVGGGSGSGGAAVVGSGMEEPARRCGKEEEYEVCNWWKCRGWSPLFDAGDASRWCLCPVPSLL